MFGFERLATAARRFEHAVLTGAADAPALAAALAAAIEASLREMPARAPGDMAAVGSPPG